MTDDIKIMQKQFARMYADKSPLTNSEANLAVTALKLAGGWTQLVTDHEAFMTSLRNY